MRPRFGLAAFATLVLAYAAWVWPTVWRYDHLGVTPVRTNRITDNVEYMNLHGWNAQIPRSE